MQNRRIFTNIPTNQSAQSQFSTQQNDISGKRKVTEGEDTVSGPVQPQLNTTARQIHQYLNVSAQSTPSIQAPTNPIVRSSSNVNLQPMLPIIPPMGMGQHSAYNFPVPSSQSYLTPQTVLEAFLSPSQKSTFNTHPIIHGFPSHPMVPEQLAMNTPIMHSTMIPTSAQASSQIERPKKQRVNAKYSKILTSLDTDAQKSFQGRVAQFLVPSDSRNSALVEISGSADTSESPVYETTISHANADVSLQPSGTVARASVGGIKKTIVPTAIKPHATIEYYFPCAPRQAVNKEMKIISEPTPNGKSKYFVEYPLADGQVKKLQVFTRDAYDNNKLLLPTKATISFEQLLTLESRKEKRTLIQTVCGNAGERVEVFTRSKFVKNTKQGKFFYPCHPPLEVESNVPILEETNGEMTHHYVEYRASDKHLSVMIPVFPASKSYDNRLMFSLEEGVSLAQLQTLSIENSDDGKRYFLMKDGERKEVFKHYTLRKDTFLGYQKNASYLKKETHASLILSSIFKQNQVPNQAVQTTESVIAPSQPGQK